MIYYYGITQQGHYHIKNGTPCQDAHKFRKINENFAIAAVADGLGSQKYTDVASKIAAEQSVQYCSDKVSEKMESDEILQTIKEAFAASLASIEEKAKNDKNPLDQYDTTLAVAVYLNGNVYFGNSGDSGIVVQNIDGTYESITEQQRDENGCVYPLCFGENHWTFGEKKDVASVLLATDGIYETLFPYLLQGEEVNIYVALAHFLMSNECLGFNKKNESEVQSKMNDFVSNIPGEQVSDDKTVLVMLNDSIKVSSQPDKYYQSPDWAALKKKRDEEYKRQAYPHLFN